MRIAVRGCRFLVSFVGAALFIGIAGCASGGGDGGEQAGPNTGVNADASANSQQRPEMPEWVLATPSEPGVAFYGVGSGSFKTPEQKERAVREADAQARREIAETMGQKIEAMIKIYACSTVTEEVQFSEESLSQDILRAFTDRCILPASIIRRYTTAEPDANGQFYMYSLAAVDFAEVVEVICNAARNSKAVATPVLRMRMEGVVADYDRQLFRAQEKAYPHAKPLSPPVAGEDEFLPTGKFLVTALGIAVPTWVRRAPNRVGVAFYGAGFGTAAGESAVTDALRDARAQARERAGALIEKVVRGVVAINAEAAGFADAERVAADAVAAVREMCVAAAPVIRRFVVPQSDGAGHRLAFALVELDFHAMLDALRAAVLNAAGNGGDAERIRTAFASVAAQAIVEQRNYADPDAVPLGPPIAGEVAGPVADSE